jgi:hypothetical protein
MPSTKYREISARLEHSSKKNPLYILHNRLKFILVASSSSLLDFLRETINLKVCFWLCDESECVLRKMMQVPSICLAQTEKRFPGGSQISLLIICKYWNTTFKYRPQRCCICFAHSRFQCDLIFLPCTTKWYCKRNLRKMRISLHPGQLFITGRTGAKSCHQFCFVIKISVAGKIQKKKQLVTHTTIHTAA